MSNICDECETVAHCTKHGCVPKQQALDKMAENARELGLDYEPAQTDWEAVAADQALTIALLKAEQPAPVKEPATSAAKGAIMGAAYDFRDAHLSGSTNLKRSAHAKLESAVDAALAEQPAPEDPSVAEPIYQCQDSNGKWTDQEKHSYDYNVKHGSAAVRVVYITPQPAQRKPLPYNKADMMDLDVNQRLAFKLGWKSAEEAHGIKENT